MATPPVPPRPFNDYDNDKSHRHNPGPPPVPPLPPNFRQESEFGSAPHFEDPLVAPRPHKLQPDLPANMARSLHEKVANNPPYPQQGSPDYPSQRQPSNLIPGFAIPSPSMAPNRGQSPLPPPQGSDWSPWAAPTAPTYNTSATPPQAFPSPYSSGPSPYPEQSYQPRHEDSISSSFAALSFGSPQQQQQQQQYRPQHARTSSAGMTPNPYPPSPPQQQYHRNSSAAFAKPPSPPQTQQINTPSPSLTAPLPTVSALTAAVPAVQQQGYDPARKVTWCRDVLSLVDRTHHIQSNASANAPNMNSTDVPVGPVRIDDPQLQRLVDIALPLLLQISSPQQMPNPLPQYIVQAIFLRATCEASGAYPQYIPHNPRTAFRDFEMSAKNGHHAAWFKLGRDYENFGDIQHARDCFERGIKYGVESCLYRMGMAWLMGQLQLSSSPETALPLLQRAATLATVDVPQPAYVFGLILLQELSQVQLPPHIIAPLIPPGSSPQGEARKHLERAAYLNFAPAQFKLGHSYEFATSPFPFDALLSVQYYSLASQQGEIEADMALSKWFLCGAEGSFEKDESLALTFAEKAARRGLPSAEFAMGYYAEVGVGGPKNIEAARKWYSRATQHGNTDAAERLQALSQPTPQSLSRQQHENLTDTTLVRKRTQAKQRSDATGASSSRPPPLPAGSSQKIVENIRKNSVMANPTSAPGAGYGSFGPQTGSPPGLSSNTQLPPIEESRHTSTPPTSVSPRMRPNQVPNGGVPGGRAAHPPSQSQGRPFANSPRYSLADPGSGSATGPRPTNVGGGGLASGPAPQPPKSRPPSAQPVQEEDSRPAITSRFSGKGPQTFAEMGITSTKVEEKDCVIM